MPDSTDRLLQAYGELERMRASWHQSEAAHQDIPTIISAWMQETDLQPTDLATHPRQLQELGFRAAKAYFDQQANEALRQDVFAQEQVIREISGELAGMMVRASVISKQNTIRVNPWDGTEYMHSVRFVSEATGKFQGTSWCVGDTISLIGAERRWYGGRRRLLYHVPMVENITGEPLVTLEEF